MTISAISSTSSTSSTASITADNQLNATSGDFLKLFMAQLQQQDPLNPEQGSDMVAQLAQLSAVEQGQQTNTDLQALAAAQGSSSNATMANLVGRTCDSTLGDFSIGAGAGTPPPISVSSQSATHGASVVITDANGNTVRKIAIPDGTSSTVQWDGRDANGNPLPPGSYHASVDPGQSATAAITATWHGNVDSVQLGNGTQLRMGDVLIDPASIQSIGATTSTTTGAHV